MTDIKASEVSLDELEVVSGGAGTQYYVYTVKKGDTLGKLAEKFGSSIDAIFNANRDKIKNKNLIKIGWKLLIPVNG